MMMIIIYSDGYYDFVMVNWYLDDYDGLDYDGLVNYSFNPVVVEVYIVAFVVLVVFVLVLLMLELIFVHH